MEAISWDIFRDLAKLDSPHECPHSLSQTADAGPLLKQKRRLGRSIAKLREEIQTLETTLASFSPPDSKTRIVLLAHEIRQLSRSIALLRSLIIPEQLRALEIQCDHYRSDL
jgi:hypothetical protein